MTPTLTRNFMRNVIDGNILRELGIDTNKYANDPKAEIVRDIFCFDDETIYEVLRPLINKIP